MKKRRIALFAVLTMLVVLLAGCTGVSSWVATGLSENKKANGWTLSANTINGYTVRNLTFTSDNLAAFYVKNTNSEGTVSVVLTQGDTEKTFNVSESFDGSIDTSAFTSGKITLRLNFGNAKKVDIAVNW